MYSYNNDKVNCYTNNIDDIRKYQGICRVCNYTIKTGCNVLTDDGTVICPMCNIDIVCSSLVKEHCPCNCTSRGQEIKNIINNEYHKIKKLHLSYSTIIYIEKYKRSGNRLVKENYLLTKINETIETVI